MINEISSIGYSSEIRTFDLLNEVTTTKFENALFTKLDNVNGVINNASMILENVAKGEDIAIHEAIIAMQKAKKEMSFMVEARNKILEAYQEIMRMQI